MTTLRSPVLRFGDDVHFWQNDGSSLPVWVQRHTVEARQQNGTFLIASKVGHQRVHHGFAVIEYGGVAHTCEMQELERLIAECRQEAAIASGLSAIGPGKATGPRRKITRSGKARIQPYAPPRGARPTIEWVPVSDLSVDETYQRRTDNDASRRLIASIAGKFDWRLFGILLVSRRPDDTFKVIDGQHRWAAAEMRGDIDQVPCCLSRFPNAEEEAQFFIVANRARKPMNRLDDFHAALAAADDDALEIKRLVEEAGLSVARSTNAATWAPAEVAFTSAIARAVRWHGAAIVSAALTNIAEAFPAQRLGHGGSLFSSLIKILASPPPAFDPDRLLSALQARDVDGWGLFMAGLKGGDTRAAAMRDAILAEYDRTSPEAEVKQAA